MKKKYYCILFLMTFLLASPWVYGQAGCNDLEILSVTDGSVCGEGSVTLEATSSGTGDAIHWYDAAIGGTYLGQGSVFQTLPISTTTSFWATEIIGSGSSGSVGPLGPTALGTISSYGTDFYYMEFTVHQSTVLISVDVFSSTSVGTNSSISIEDDNGTLIQNVPYTTTATGNSSPNTVALNVPLSPGDYRIRQGTDHIALFRNTSGAVYPYTSPVIDITGNNFNTAYYYWMYNFQYSTLTVVCESPREEVIATVNNDADEDVLTLPYTHTANTGDYANNYSGAPGADCGASDAYLDGYDVVYSYTADDDYILTVELSGLSEAYTGVFIYESCSDIGTTCYAEGSYNETAGTHSFQVAVEDGEEYFIVVSSSDPTETYNYTLNISAVTCANYPAPTGAGTQDFIDDQTLADLDVTGTDLTWYSDAGLTTVIPDDTVLIDATTYYVTQSFQGCEGAALAVTVNEVACTDLEVVSTTGGSVCGEGFAILEAQGAGPAVNTDIYWYDAATGGDMVGKGSPFTTPELEQTTSFWAAEVVISGGELSGQAKTAPTSTTTTTLTNYGLQFDVFTPFTLVSVEVYPTTGGLMDLELRDASGTVLNSITGVNVPNGDGVTPVTLTLNMDIPAGNGLRLLKTSAGSPTMIRESSGNVYPYLIGTVGEITGGALNQGTPLTAYYWFYNWTITEAVALCESPREEVIATVNDVADEIVAEPLPYVHTANTSTYGNNYEGEPGGDCNDGTSYLNGNDVVYQYSPTVGGVYSIDLSGLSSNNAAVFVYESCYDIGGGCYAGAVNDGTTNDFGIAEVSLFDGFDYFIVISTSDSPSTDYTLTIDLATIDCSDYTAAPGGDEDQFFEDGDTLSDLVVNGGNLTWYSDASGTTTIPDTTLLIDGTTYYVGQTLNGCDSDLLAITVTEIDCDDLEIVDFTDATIVCKGVAQLEAVGNGGLGTEIYWYDAAVDGELLGTGPVFTTDELTTTTSYWATEVFIEGEAPLSGQGKPAPTGTSSFSTTLPYGVMFNAFQSFTIASVDVYPNGAGGTIDVELWAPGTNTIIASTTASVPSGDGNTPYTIPLNFPVTPGQEYRLIKTNPSSVTLIRDSSGNVYPYPLGTVGEVVGGVNGMGNSLAAYYWFFNWTIGTGEVLCESPREEVVATVTQDGNEVVGALPYTHTANTSDYGNTYSGTPGNSCGTSENYLNGADVVYQFTAPNDDLLTIELSGLSDYYGGLFVYEVCGDIGDECLAGAVGGPSSDGFSIEEFEVEQGQSYYIVVSSWLTSNIDYTLDIYGFDCANFEAPIGDTNQDFTTGDTLADLSVTETMGNVTFTWYSDASLTTVIPDTTPLVDGDTYYVTQTFDTCEGAALAITVHEIDCSDLEIVSTTGDSVVCLGSMTLEATAGGSGSEIYWYDAATDGNLVGIGSTYTTDVLTSTTSYWAAEVHLEQGSGNNVLPSPCTPVHGTSGCGSGDNIDDFVLSELGNPLISHLGTGCSSNAYGDFTGDSSLTAVLIAGSTYDVALTHTYQTSQWVKIWIDFDFDGTFDEATEVVFESTSGSSGGVTNGSFSIPSSVIGSNTIMRVSTRFAALPDNACTIGGSFGETHDYRVNVVGSSALCESPREEVVATVHQTGDIALDDTDLPYTDQDSTFNFGNNFSGGSGCSGLSGNYLDGYDVVYQFSPSNDDIVTIELSGLSNTDSGVFVYESCGDVGGDCLAGVVGNGVIEDFYVTGGQDYFIVIGSESGSTSYTLDIYGFECTALAAPGGDSPQIYVDPATLADLDVDEYIHSTGLTWYEDAAGTQPVPDTTPLVDGETYWVSQTVLGCESALLEITVNELDCSVLGATSVEGGVLCAPGGEMTLTAQGSGNGNEIYWYDTETGDNIVGIGEEITVDVNSTISYWVGEVYLEDGVGAAGSVGPVNPSAVGSAGGGLGSTYEVEFDVLIPTTLLSVDIYPTATVGSSGTIEIHEAGGGMVTSVSYTTTVTGGSTPQTILFNAPLTPGSYYMVQATPTVALYRNTSGATYPYTSPAINITGNTFGATYYYHFYNWQFGGGTVLCESPRTEVIAEVNTDIPGTPVGDSVQEFCGEETTLSSVVLVGESLVWYDSDGQELPLSTILEDGETYYATQTVEACESDVFAVTVLLTAKSPMPLGSSNQEFDLGDTLEDLDVVGDNLTWYSDSLGLQELPLTTELQDVTTYYVSQQTDDLCESDLLAITVHRGPLGLVDEVFSQLYYYPNPMDDKLTIENSYTLDEVSLYTMTGQRLYTNRVDSDITTLDVTELSSGVYFLQVRIGDKLGVYRVIKE